MELKALLFDVDGVLADTEEAHRWAFNAAFAELSLGWVWDRALYGKLLAISGGKARIHHYLKQNQPDELDHRDIDDKISRIHERKNQIYADLLAEGGIALRPGVERLIGEAREQGLRLGVASASSPANIAALFKSAMGGDALKWFDAIGAGGGAGGAARNMKPAPDIYRWVLDILKLAPGECLAIEDSSNGLKASRRAGIGAVITTTDYTRDEDFTGALAVLSDLGEPDKPFQIWQGESFDKSCVDVDLLRRWRDQART